MNVRSRPVARLVVLDPRDRILLFETRLDYTHVWMTPGGGVHPGESFEECARRELWEEVGILDAELGPSVWTVQFEFERKGEIIAQSERYFVVRLESDEVDDANRGEGTHGDPAASVVDVRRAPGYAGRLPAAGAGLVAPGRARGRCARQAAACLGRSIGTLAPYRHTAIVMA